MNPKLREQLIEALRLEEREVYEIDGLLDLADLWRHRRRRRATPSCATRPGRPVTQPRLQGEDDEPVDIFAAIRQGDMLVHHPYDSFATSVERFVEQAVADPDVLAIKQTVYRTSDDSPLVPSLIRASERGKQAVCMVELKARFDEEANIQWAKALEEAGVHVVYGIPGLKTHVKAILVARREGDRVRHYVHIGTGNYNPKTARLYTDLGLFTADPDIGADVAEMFNFLTGYGRPAELPQGAGLADDDARRGSSRRSSATVEAHRAGEQARIALKMNSLVDAALHPGALRGLAGRGAGRPQRARHLLPAAGGAGRLGEHPRRLDRRPLPRALAHLRLRARRGDAGADRLRRPDAAQPRQPGRAGRRRSRTPALRAELLDVLERCLADNTNAWELGADGRWTRRRARRGRAAATSRRSCASATRRGPPSSSRPSAAESPAPRRC